MLDGSGQRLHGRLLGHADLAEAQALVPEWLPLSARVRGALPKIWTRLLGQPGYNADVVEDLSRPAGQRLVALGMAIALDERWRRQLATDPRRRMRRRSFMKSCWKVASSRRPTRSSVWQMPAAR